VQRLLKSRILFTISILSGLFLATSGIAGSLEAGWENPPTDARLRAYWWWLNGNVTSNSIRDDLEQMKAKGFGGAVLIDAGGADQFGNEQVPHGPTFFTPEWRGLYKYTLQVANKVGMEISLNILSGWNLGGPVVTPDDAAKKYVWTETKIPSGYDSPVTLPQPKTRDDYYKDSKVVAYRIQKTSLHAPLKFWKEKALQASLAFSAPDSSCLFEELPGKPGEQDADTKNVLDLTGKLAADGTLDWKPTAGDWEVFRFGYTIGDHAHVSTGSEGWNGYALDVYSVTAFENYWNKIVEPLIDDAGPLAGKTLKYLHTDSWEIELANWTPNFPADFRERNGYDLTPWLPVLAGRIVNSREASDRFLFDYRKTLGDLAIDHHYRLFRDQAHKHGTLIHPESGGPHEVPIDAQRCLGWDDAPMSEFWAWSWEHRIGDSNRFFVKQPASAAHTYGHKLVFAEGFTSIGPNWQESIWSDLKPCFDKALCEGMNVLVWHAFVCSPDETGIPGQQYLPGTHLNPKVTWWNKSAPFFSYINRSQWMMQQGHFAADVLYYYGDHVPNFAQIKASDPAHIGPGYDYDVITAEALIERARVVDGRIVLPDGMSYRVLVLPDRREISLAVLKKIKELAEAGATIVGPKPERGETLADKSATDAEIKKIANSLWKGKVISNRSARKVLLDAGVVPDCQFLAKGDFDYIHRNDGDTDIYFVAHRTNTTASSTVAFRVTGKVPEIWNAVTGEHTYAAAYEEQHGRTYVPLNFAPCGSWFVVFREPSRQHPATAAVNSITPLAVQDISSHWTVRFDPKWGGPATAQFGKLVSWTSRPEPGIQYYSGTAVYEKSFNWKPAVTPPATSRLYLDLGNVHEIAGIKINGKSCGIVWSPPWRVDISDAIKSGENKLDIEVVNLWANRVIGDARSPEGKQYTRTNIRNLTATNFLIESGLLGPVRILQQTSSRLVSN
jgi:hypothetical protein